LLHVFLFLHPMSGYKVSFALVDKIESFEDKMGVRSIIVRIQAARTEVWAVF